MKSKQVIIIITISIAVFAVVAILAGTFAWFESEPSVQRELEVATDKVQYLVFEADTAKDFTGSTANHVLYPAKVKKAYLHDNKLLDGFGNLIEINVFDEDAEYLDSTANKLCFFQELDYYGYESETIDFTYFASTVYGTFNEGAVARLSNNDVAVDLIVYKRVDIDEQSWSSGTYFIKSDDYTDATEISNIYALSSSFDSNGVYYERVALDATHDTMTIGLNSDLGVYCEVYFPNVDELIDYTVFNRKLFIYVKASISDYYLYRYLEDDEDEVFTEPLIRNEDNTRWKEYIANIELLEETKIYVANSRVMGDGIQAWGYSTGDSPETCCLTLSAGEYTVYFSPDYVYGNTTHLLIRNRYTCNISYDGGTSSKNVDMLYSLYDSSLGEGIYGVHNSWYVGTFFPSQSTVTIKRGLSIMYSCTVSIGGFYVLSFDGENATELVHVDPTYRYFLYSYNSENNVETYETSVEYLSAENNCVTFRYQGVLSTGNYRLYDSFGYMTASGNTDEVWVIGNGIKRYRFDIIIQLGTLSNGADIGLVSIEEIGGGN